MTIEINRNDLLNAVRQLPPEELNAFIEQALSVRTRSKLATLSEDETKLIERINRGLSADLTKRSALLIRRRNKGVLTADEQLELIELTDQAENRDADRAAALLDLARLRRVPLRALMKQMGIKPRPIHG